MYVPKAGDEPGTLGYEAVALVGTLGIMILLAGLFSVISFCFLSKRSASCWRFSLFYINSDRSIFGFSLIWRVVVRYCANF